MYKLPFQGTIRSVVHDADGVHVDVVIEDAEGKNVQSHPFTAGPKRTAAEICEMVQQAVSDYAKSYHTRELATLGDADAAAQAKLSKEELEEFEKKRSEELVSLKGRTFTGSVTR
jgi:hypothetical protein